MTQQHHQQHQGLWLGIDTSTRNLGLALVTSEGASYSISDESGEQHSRRLLPLLQELLIGRGSLQEIDEVAINTGPGSFTGLRVGIAAARGLSAALGVPLRGVDSFDAHAASGSLKEGLVVVLLGVSRGELAAGVRQVSEHGRISGVGDDLCGLPEQIVKTLNERLGGQAVFVTGDAVDEFGEGIAGSQGRLVVKRGLAEAVAVTGRGRSLAGEVAEGFEAHYLRAAEAEIRKNLNEQ